MKSRFAIVIGVVAFAANAAAAVRLPAVFSDHMVLQRDRPVPVWGWADPGETVTVEFAGQKKSATAGADGQWKVTLDPMPGSAEPRVFKAGDVTIQDVLVGDVWLGSGQSNMAMTVNRAKDFEKEKAAATFPSIRMFRESSGPATAPQPHCSGSWQVCSPQTVGGFSATAYFFGREIHKALGMPVGLINSSVGGTPVEAWTSWEAQKDLPELKPLFESWAQRQAAWDPQKAQATYQQQLAAWKAAGKKGRRPPRRPVEPRLDPHHPAVLFNGKIAPLIPYAIRGAIWYQGENNANSSWPHLYGLQLATLIRDWRERWGSEFPFAWVQLPNFRAPQKEPVEDGGWPLVREEMLKTLRLPNTGMAITIDIGEADDIHPKNKQEVGRRLALWALAEVHKRPGIIPCGPLPVDHKVHGSEVTITFKYADDGLVVKIGSGFVTPRDEWPNVWPPGGTGFGQVLGFALAGADRRWYRADAKIVGNTVVVRSDNVKEPVAVRYAWANNPDCNLYNRAGLPASPFRTDNWPLEIAKPAAAARR